MEISEPARVKVSQRDIGLGVIILGVSYAISIITELSYVGIVLGLVAIIILLYRRHTMSVPEGRALYASIIIFVVGTIAFVVAFLVEIFGIAGTVVSQGYTSGNLPDWAIKAILNFSLVSGGILAGINAFCYFIIPYPMAEKNLQFALIGGILVSIGLKVLELYLSVNNLFGAGTVNLSNALSIARAAPYTMPYIAISAVSSLSLGLVIIYVGYLVRVGKLNKFPGEGDLFF